MVISRRCPQCKKIVKIEVPAVKSRKEIERFCKLCGHVMNLSLVPKNGGEYYHQFKGKEFDILMAYAAFESKKISEATGDEYNLSPEEAMRRMMKTCEKMLKQIGAL